MAETKRISDQYTISAPTIIIDGNLRVSGSTTSVETTNSTITDNIIILNEGETLAGIAGGAGTSGIEIERGSLTNVSFVYDDTVDAFRALEGTGLTNVRVKTPILSDDDNTVATKKYVDDKTSTGSVSAAGVQGSVQYNNANVISGDSVLLWDGTNLAVGNTSIGSNIITVDDTNGNLELSANGSGTVYARSVVRMENEASDPAGISGSGQLYAKTPAEGGSGIFFSNTDNTGELVSKSKAIIYGIIF